MRCPHCKNKLVQKSGNVTRVRVQGVLEFTDDACISHCYWCKQEVRVPLKMDSESVPESEAFHLKIKPA